jgi:two-component system, NtrC family, nitrogen regulation response regulator GlnG
MAPTQVIDEKDLPPEVQASHALKAEHFVAQSVATADATPVLVEVNQALSVASSIQATTVSSSTGWEADLAAQALAMLAKDNGGVWDELTARFERILIQAALTSTRNRRIEAAVKLGIGRNTITRKIQELGLE